MSDKNFRIALVGAAASLFGLLQGVELMRDFELPAQIGLGGAALAAVFAIAAGGIVTKQTGQR